MDFMVYRVQSSVMEWGSAARNDKASLPATVIGTGATCLGACLHCAIAVVETVPPNQKRWIHASQLAVPAAKKTEWLPPAIGPTLRKTTPPEAKAAPVLSGQLPAVEPAMSSLSPRNNRKLVQKGCKAHVFAKAKGMAGACLVVDTR